MERIEPVKTAFSTIICHEYSLPQIADAARRHGYDGVELYAFEGQKAAPALVAERLDDIQRDMAGVCIPAIHSWVYLDYRESEARRERAATIQQALELAAQLEVPLVKIFGADPPSDLSLDDAFDSIAECATPLARRAGELGVTLMIETHDGLPRGVDVNGVLSRVNEPSMGALWDVFHPHRRGEDVRETDELIGSRVVHVHAKDASRHPGEYQDRFKGWKFVPPGQGEVPVKQAIALLHARGYDGFVAVDAERMWSPEDYEGPEVLMQQYAKALREYIDAAA